MMDGRTMQAWQVAAMIRAKKMPKLEELLSKDEKPVDLETKMKLLLKGRK